MTDTLSLKEGDIETTEFDNNNFTRILHNGEWWYVVTEVIAFLTDSKNPHDYLEKIKSRDIELSKDWKQFVNLLEVETEVCMVPEILSLLSTSYLTKKIKNNKTIQIKITSFIN